MVFPAVFLPTELAPRCVYFWKIWNCSETQRTKGGGGEKARQRNKSAAFFTHFLLKKFTPLSMRDSRNLGPLVSRSSVSLEETENVFYVYEAGASELLSSKLIGWIQINGGGRSGVKCSASWKCTRRLVISVTFEIIIWT